MREILFRGKRIDNGEWVEGYVYRFPPICRIRHWLPIFEKYGDAEVNPSTVSQYTGMKDWNGKKVFEDDFVRVDGSLKRALDITDGVVRYGRGGFYVSDFDLLNSLNTIAAYDGVLRGEVIGNIHDNPELMEDEK